MTERRFRLGIILLAALFLGGSWAYRVFAPPVVFNATSATGSGIVVLGDSIAAGFGVRPEECFVALLAKRYGLPIVNAGVSGDTTAGGLARLQGDVLSHKPRVVIVELGGNDILRRVPRNEIRANLAAIVEVVQDAGAAVVLVGVDGPLGMGSVTPTMRELSREHGTALVPGALKGIIGTPSLMADQIHPNAAGHVIVADRIARVLERRLPATFRAPE